jgi:hypothetical protein
VSTILFKFQPIFGKVLIHVDFPHEIPDQAHLVSLLLLRQHKNVKFHNQPCTDDRTVLIKYQEQSQTT